MSRPAAGYQDRRQAGRALAAALEGERGPRTVVVGLARGGVPVAAEVATALGAPLDVVVVRKIGHPFQPELAVGAVTADGRVSLPPRADVRVARPMERAITAARAEARAIDARLRAGHPPVPLEGADCILVDDGLATGTSMRAAVCWARAHDAARVVVGVPVASRLSAEALREEADALISQIESDAFGSVGEWYRNFGQVPEAEVSADLRADRERRS